MAVDGDHERRSDYTYDFMNRLIFVEDLNDEFDESFAYDMQGRITVQRRGSNAKNGWGGEYSYYKNSNKLEKVNQHIGNSSADKRNMNVSGNFVYDTTGNLIEDKSKRLKISYDWRGMPVEFVRETCTAYGHYTVCDSTKLVMAYDGSGRRVSKTRMKKTAFDGPWYADLVTHYTGIGTEIRENMPGGTLKDVRVVVNMPQGLGRYGIEDAADAFRGVPLDENGKPTSWSALNPKFEWYLKNHLGSTMLVYGTQWADRENLADVGAPIAAYDYRSFGEQVTLAESADKVTENFTGKELDDETKLNYFGARYLDPMLGLWTSVDPARQFASPYLYAGNGYNPVNGVDDDGNEFRLDATGRGLLLTAMNDCNPKVQDRLAILASSNLIFKSAPITSDMKQQNPHFDQKTLTFYYNENYGMPLIEQFYHEMLGHGYQGEVGLAQKLDNNGYASWPISNEVDAYEMQFLAPGGESSGMFNLYQKSGSREYFAGELMTNEQTADTYGDPMYIYDYE